jgi:hypothetical protein
LNVHEEPQDLPKLLLDGNNGHDWQVRVGAFARFQSQLGHANAAGTDGMSLKTWP